MEARLLCNQECKNHKAKRLGRKGASWLHTGNLDAQLQKGNGESSISESTTLSVLMLLQGMQPTASVLSMLR